MDTKLRCAFEIPSENQNDLSAAQEANRSRSDPDHRRVEHIVSVNDFSTSLVNKWKKEIQNVNSLV